MKYCLFSTAYLTVWHYQVLNFIICNKHCKERTDQIFKKKKKYCTFRDFHNQSSYAIVVPEEFSNTTSTWGNIHFRAERTGLVSQASSGIIISLHRTKKLIQNPSQKFNWCRRTADHILGSCSNPSNDVCLYFFLSFFFFFFQTKSQINTDLHLTIKFPLSQELFLCVMSPANGGCSSESLQR